MYDAPTFGRSEQPPAARAPASPVRAGPISGAALCRAFDIIVALAAILFTAPLLIMISLGVRLHDGGPALFGHERIGRGGRVFRCMKFRSMVVDAETRLGLLLSGDSTARDEWSTDFKLRQDPRITPLGEFLRRSSLDELPQLFNVLRGDMSIVGPRPIVHTEAARYGARLESYCAVRPGITGLWQISGRNDVSYRRRVAMDAVYARSKCLTWDIKILLLTVPAVFLAKGSY
jgi:exopolysaccharide production protein ExoY